MLAVDHQHQHDVIGGISAANHAMAKRSLAAILLVSVNVELAGKIRHIVEDGASSTVFYQAFLRSNNFVRSACVKTRANRAALTWRKWRCCLVTIRQRLVHSTDGLDSYVIDACQWGEKFFYLRLLAFKLDGIGDRKPFTASAATRNRACWCLVSHSSSPNLGLLLYRLRA